MSNIKVAAVQMSCDTDLNKNIDKAEKLVREAAENGAKIILLPELFERRYFCQERQYSYYTFAKPVEENEAVIRFTQLSKELSVVIPVSIYERDNTTLYNTVVMLDSGENLGIYRKTHIPDDHFIGICWDQWFPETARSLALLGADIILYPTAIGSEPILGMDSSGHWTRTMQGHSAANIIPVVAANRYGLEEVKPCPENSNQESALNFYGSSFMTNETGEIIAKACRDKEEILYSEYDFVSLRDIRLEWGIFRDRRPEMYGYIV